MFIINLCECDGGDMGAGGDFGNGGGITSDSVLGPSGKFENGEGVMGPDDFHIPFPVMPVLYRYKDGSRGKKGKKPKNPYIGKVKILNEGDAPMIYTGDARKEFEKITKDTADIFCNVLYFNDTYKLLWRIVNDGTLELFKPIDFDNKWYIYHTKLSNDDNIVLIDKNGPYDSINTAYKILWDNYNKHKNKLNEMLKKL